MKLALNKAYEEEESALGKKILNQLEENLKIAENDMIPICQDTGMAVIFIKVGQEVHFTGGNLEDAINEGVRRGYHAHKSLKQLLFCPYGRIQLILENKNGREEIELYDPSIAVLIDQPTWREMLWLQKDSVLCVAASDYFDSEDYIRNYEEYRELYL